MNRRPSDLPGVKPNRKKAFLVGDAVPKPLGFTAFRQNGCSLWGGWRRPAIPAAGSALGSHPCVAFSSAQVRSVYKPVVAPKEYPKKSLQKLLSVR
jgi:hypothetical protein